MRERLIDKLKQNWKVYAVAIAIPLAVGFAAAMLTGNGMRDYASMNKPPLSPPGWVFPVVWTILYILMGISSGMIYLSNDPAKKDALRIYGLQLCLNFGWSILYFGFHWFFAAFIWIIVLEALIVVMIAMFYSIRKPAGLLQIPYGLWVAFAAYLNLAVWLMNQ